MRKIISAFFILLLTVTSSLAISPRVSISFSFGYEEYSIPDKVQSILAENNRYSNKYCDISKPTYINLVINNFQKSDIESARSELMKKIDAVKNIIDETKLSDKTQMTYSYNIRSQNEGLELSFGVSGTITVIIKASNVTNPLLDKINSLGAVTKQSDTYSSGCSEFRPPIPQQAPTIPKILSSPANTHR